MKYAVWCDHPESGWSDWFDDKEFESLEEAQAHAEDIWNQGVDPLVFLDVKVKNDQN